VKKLTALFVVLALSLVFANAALAQENIADVENVTLGPGGSVIISGTAQCVEGQRIFVDVTVRQRGPGGVFNTAFGFVSLQCSTTGTTNWTTGPVFGSSPFHAGRATIQMFADRCDPDFEACVSEREVKAVKLTNQ
jgi:hypothetical protein